MRTTPVLAVVAGASLLAVSCGSHQLVVCKKLSFSKLAEEKYGPRQYWIEAWPDESVQCSIGEYVFVTPAASSDVDHVMVYRGTDEMFARQEGVSLIFENGRPVLDATDSDGDGAFDKVSYTVYGADGWDEIAIRDVNFDGQPDLKVYHRKSAREYWMWIEDAWYRAPRLGSMQVLVDGTPRTYRTVDGRFVFVNEMQ